MVSDQTKMIFKWKIVDLGIICTLVYYTASSTGRDDCEYATRQTIGHWMSLHAHVLSEIVQNKRFRVWKITHPPHPGRLLQYSIPTGMLRALAELKCRAIEHSTASNRGRGVHVRVSTNQCSFQVSRSYQRGAEEELMDELGTLSSVWNIVDKFPQRTPDINGHYLWIKDPQSMPFL